MAIERFWVKQQTRAVRANFYAAEIVYASYYRQVQLTTRVGDRGGRKIEHTRETSNAVGA